MPISEAKLAANRRNSLKSTGPKTPEGKARTRCNALKHGLTGEGVALGNEDQVEITRRFTDLQDEFRPKTDAGSLLVRRFAFLSVRIERCEQHETAELSKKVRHAVAEFDDARLAAVEALVSRIEREPATCARRLQATPEGVDWLMNHWNVLRADLLNEDRNCWTGNHRSQFQLLLGENPGGFRITRIAGLSDALLGGFYNLDNADGEGLEGQARSDWARGELTRLMDVEIARLREVRIKLDPEAIARDRAEAADRALFDPSPEMVLARKYEAATERGMYRALKELRQVEAEAAERPASDASHIEAEECESVGSSFREPEPESSEAEPRPASTPRRVESAPSVPSVLDFSVGNSPETGPRSVEIAARGVA